MKKKILVTGSTGFIGSFLIKELILRGYKIRINKVKFYSLVNAKKLKSREWSILLKNIDCIVHCGGKTPRGFFSIKKINFIEENFYPTKLLLEQATLNKVKHFIFLSSFAVNLVNILKYKNTNYYNYAISKKKIEQLLKKKTITKKLRTTIIRAPLVFGPNVRGNFLFLLKWISYGLPLFLFDFKKKIIGVQNLVDFIIYCVKFSKLTTGTFHVYDKKDNFKYILMRISILMNKKIFFISVPKFFLFFLQKIILRKSSSLNFHLNNRKKIKWTPPITLTMELKKTVEWFLNNK